MKIEEYNKIGLENVENLEQEYRIELPSDHKNFLLESNGGLIQDAYLYVKYLKEFMLMRHFFGIDTEKGFSNISKINDEFDSGIPKKTRCAKSPDFELFRPKIYINVCFRTGLADSEIKRF